jgi:UDP:flavonoid glycosyltransferase YjiC (YdhE family)
MSTFLAYTSPAAGHLFPLIPGLLELQHRGHDVVVVTDPDLVATAQGAGLRAVGIDQRILDVPVADHELPAGRTRLRRSLAQLMGRAPFERADLDAHLDDVRPDALLVDTNAYGALVAAEASGLPWATTLPSLLPLPGPGIPPYGLGMRPARGPLGRLRDRAVWPAVIRAYGKAMLPPLNEVRAAAGLAAFSSPLQQLLAADRLLVLTGAPLEYPRHSLPPSVRLVGAQIWDPPAATPAWLDEPGLPWVLVTCSTDYQADDVLARTALEALADEPVRVVVTLADAYDGFDAPVPSNARVERFVPHRPVLAQAAAVVCPGGMGIAAKAVGSGVPVVAVPFGRDQPEVTRRVVEAGAGVAVRRRDLSPSTLRDAVRRAIPMRPALPVAAPATDAAAAFADAALELLTARTAACTGA